MKENCKSQLTTLRTKIDGALCIVLLWQLQHVNIISVFFYSSVHNRPTFMAFKISFESRNMHDEHLETHATNGDRSDKAPITFISLITF